MSEDQIKNLQRQLDEERSLREEAEAQLQVWRQKAIDTKMNAVKTRTELTEEVEIAAANSRIPMQQPEGDAAQLKRENAALTKQRDQLLRDLEALRNTDTDETGGDDMVQKERRSRRASEAISSTLREQLAESEKQRYAAENEAQRLRIDLDRMKNLLTAAEQIIVQGRGTGTGKTAPTPTTKPTNDEAGTRDLVTTETPDAGNNHDTLKKAGIASLAVLAVGAAGTAGAVAMRQSQQ